MPGYRSAHRALPPVNPEPPMTTNLTVLSRSLTTRPADEHFATFADLRTAAATDDRNARVCTVASDSLEVVADADQLMLVSKKSGRGYPMTYHSSRRVAQLAGANADFVFGRLTPRVAAIALTDSLSRTSEDVQLHLGTVTRSSDLGHDGPVVRGITGTTYARVSDNAILHEVNEWLLPSGFVPALPTMNTDAQRNNIMGNNKPALFRGLSSSLFFFMAEGRGGEGAGGRPCHRGVLTSNSEVGQGSVKVTRFIFDALCANFIVWGARELQTTRRIHRGEPSRILRDVREQLRRETPEIMAAELDIMRRAAEVAFAPDLDTAVERLIKQFELSEAAAKTSLLLAAGGENRGTNALTHAWVANGVTSFAKSAANADRLVELATVGGDIYLAAGAR